jgi:hypothetical protein
LGFILWAWAFLGLKNLLNKSELGLGLYYINEKVGLWILFSKKPKPTAKLGAHPIV